MDAPLIHRLTDVHRFIRVDPESLDDFLAQPGEWVLFVTDDPRTNRETNDVAVVLPELVRAAGGRLSGAVADRALEPALKGRFRLLALPALLFFRNGAYLGKIVKMRDWDVYLSSMAAILAGTASTTDTPDTETAQGAAP